MNDRHISDHLSAPRLEAFLEGELADKERAAVEEHLSSCARCAAEADAWRSLYAELAELPRLAPSPGFAAGVLEQIHVPERVPLAARVRRALGVLVPSRASDGHVPAGRLQDFVDDALPAAAMARVRAHLEGCDRCATEAGSWASLVERLGTLERFAPAEGFAERVLAAVQVGRRVPATAHEPSWRRLLAAARSVLPRTRRAWAAISGVAVTPAATAGLALWVLVSHPTLTPGALASFVWWKASALAGAAWQALVAGVLESSELFGVYALAESLSAAPVAVAGGALAYSLACLMAVRVLYKNLIAPRRLDARHHARLSLS